MSKDVEDYHKKRRPFVIIPQIGIIISHLENSFSHSELLQNCGFSAERIKEMIENYPRGYFLDNKLVIYQGDDVKEGECWTLKSENFHYVQDFWNDLCHIFDITPKTKVFLGVKRGKIGELWPVVNEVNIDFFVGNRNEHRF